MFENFDIDPERDDEADSNGLDDDESLEVLGESLQEPRQSTLIMGHDAVEQELLSYWNGGKMPHALIFSGLRGIGKATMAYRLARFVLKYGKDDAADAGPGLFGDALPVEKPTSLDVAEDDPVFSRVASGGHADFLVVEPPVDERTGQTKSDIPVKEIRKVNPFLQMTASEGGWRVVIVDDADTATRSGQNAILKILEEPPEKAVLILVAHRAGTLLPTIRSRCRMINFQALDRETFGALLKVEYDTLYTEDLDILYSIAEGSVGQGMRIMEEGGLETIDNVLGLLNSWPQWNWPTIHAMADTMGRKGQERNLKAFQDITLWIFETFVRCKARGQSLPSILAESKVAQFYNQYSLARWIEICDRLRQDYTLFDRANLDKKQAIIGTFTLLDSMK